MQLATSLAKEGLMRTQIRRSAYVCCALGLLLSIQATSDGSPTPERPKLLEEIAKVLPPGPSGQIVRRVALSDKHLLIFSTGAAMVHGST